MITNFRPQNDRVLLKPVDLGDHKQGAILLADLGEDKAKVGEVIAVGPGRTTEFGTKIDVNVKVGDTVLIPKIGFQRVDVDGEEYWVGPDKEIIAVVDIVND